jgi:Predicted permease, DMT superfamily
MKKLNPLELRGTIQISIASMGFGFLGIFAKIAYANNLSVGELLSYRFILAALLIWIFLLLFRLEWIRVSKRQLVTSALLGIFGYGLFSTLYFQAIEGLSITLAALLLYTYPFWVSIFSHFFTHEKISKEEGLCLLGAFMGLLLLLWGHMEVRNFWAIFAGLGSAISYAIYVLVSGKVQKNVRPISSTVYVISFAALALVLFHRPPLHEVTHLTEPQGWAVLGLAIVCTIIPLTLELAALQKLKSATVALLMMIEPVTAAILGMVIFHERLTLQQTIGALIVLGCLVINTLMVNKNSNGFSSK